jgi:hypothetical protein
MRAGHLTIKIRDAILREILRESTAPEENEVEVFCAAKIDDVGKLYTETRPLKETISWQDDEELTFNLTPADPTSPPRTLQLMLYRQHPKTSEHHLLGMGSISLEGLEEGANTRDIEVPLVNDVFKNIGLIRATCHFFPSRCPGKSRDDLGREVLDPILVSKGSKEGAKELNERSPKNSPRKIHSGAVAAASNYSKKAEEYQPTEVSKGLPPEELLPVG